jgi:hypothetical protein
MGGALKFRGFGKETTYLQPPIELFDAFAQLQWAKQQISYFATAVTDFLQNNIFFISKDADDKTGTTVFKTTQGILIQRDFLARSGSIINSLCAALDYLAVELMRKSSTDFNERSVYFPIKNTHDQFVKTISSGSLSAISDEAKDLMKKIKPYKEGNYDLWLLRELNNQTKHRRLIYVGPKLFVIASEEEPMFEDREVPQMKIDRNGTHDFYLKSMKVVQPLPIWEIKDPEIIKEMDMPEYGGTEIYSSSGDPGDLPLQ